MKTYGSWIAFCYFVFKTKLMNLSSLLITFELNIKTMTLKVLLMKIVLFISYYFPIKMTCVSLGQKIWKKKKKN